MNKIKKISFPAFTLLSSCVVFNPYISTAEIEEKVIGTSNSPPKMLSRSYRKKFESYASELSQISKGTTVVLAGLLGLGGYKGVTDGGSHQFAALGAGAGVTYGLHRALYKPSREQIYMGGANALICIDRVYEGFDSSLGKKLASKYYSDDLWPAYADRFYTTLSMVQQYETEYKYRVLAVPALINKQLSTEQPSAEQSYAFISSAISLNTPSLSSAPTPAAGEVSMPIENPAQKFSDLEDWVAQSEQLDTAYKANPNKDCPTSGNLAPIIVRQNNEAITKLSVNSKSQFPIQNTSGSLASSITPQNSNDKDAIETKILVDKGVFSIEIDAKAKTNKPIWVTVVDYGNGGVTSGFWVTIE